MVAAAADVYADRPHLCFIATARYSHFSGRMTRQRRHRRVFATAHTTNAPNAIRLPRAD
jgi:hypothetical protein